MKMILWCCKWLGYQTLQAILAAQKTTVPTAELVGVVVSSKDSWRPQILELVKDTQVKIFTDLEPVTVVADVGLCVAFPHKLDSVMLATCRQGVLNLHFAPLPAYRGSGTLTWALINQEPEFGVTLHWMDEKLDTGPIIERSHFPLPPEVPIEILETRLEKHAWEFLESWLDRIMEGELPAGTPQSQLIQDTGIHPRFCTKASVVELYQLSLTWPAEKIMRYLRALPVKKDRRPFFMIENQKVWLELEPHSHSSHTQS